MTNFLFVVFQKAFDIVEHWYLWRVFKNKRHKGRCSRSVQKIYEGTEATIISKIASNESCSEISYKNLGGNISLSTRGVVVESFKDGVMILSEVLFKNVQYFIILLFHSYLFFNYYYN